MDRMELIDAEVDKLSKLSLEEESGSSKNIGNEIKNKENTFEIKNYSNSKIIEDTEMVDLEQNEESNSTETPLTTSKAKMSKKKRDREKKKILESKNLGKEYADEIFRY
uniref:Uncharacterized protein n=1 Tax=Meloidogyne enterolobii TaxID=390850 RepID=A0A6V7V357_MELEN|nr:unnamed protein product [Meloidogyne enterolobii]